MTITLRPAVAADAAAIAAVYTRSWPLSMTHLGIPHVVDAFVASRGVDFWAGRLADPRWSFRVADDRGRIAGFVAWDPDPGRPELDRLFVLPDTRGTGVGDRLYQAALAGLGRGGGHTAELWAVPGNARAEAFYRRRGWTPTDQVQQIPTPAGMFPLRRWTRPLTG